MEGSQKAAPNYGHSLSSTALLCGIIVIIAANRVISSCRLARFLRTTAILVLAISPASCASLGGEVAEEAVEKATPEAVRSFLESLNKPETRALVAKLLETPEVKQAARVLGEGLAQGVLDGLTAKERQDHFRKLAKEFVQQLSAAVSQSLEQEITPEIASMAAKTVDAAIQKVFSKGSFDQAQQFASMLTNAVVSALASGIENEIGPAIAKTLVDQIGPALTEALRGELAETFGASARLFARGLVVGVDDGLVILQARQNKGLPTVLGNIEGAASEGKDILQVTAIALGSLVIALWTLLIFHMVQARRERRETERREEALLALMRALKGAQDEPWAADLLDLLRNELRGREGTDYLRELLREHPSLRLTRHKGARPRKN